MNITKILGYRTQVKNYIIKLGWENMDKMR